MNSWFTMFNCKKKSSFCVLIPFLLLFVCHVSPAIGGVKNEVSWRLVKREERKSLFTNEYGEISAVQLSDEISRPGVLNFFTLEPNSLLLPHILHAQMVFYVQTGSGRLCWTSSDHVKSVDLRPGDVYTLEEGAVFFIHSNLETSQRNKLRIQAIFSNYGSTEEISIRPYTSISDSVLGFDRKVLQAAFKVPVEVIDELLGGVRQPEIVHGTTKEEETKKKRTWTMVDKILLVQRLVMKKNAKASEKAFNVLKKQKDFVNENGWSTTVTKKKLSTLKSSNIGVFMVNLTAGSMMGPHWNPTAGEIAVVAEGRGMVSVWGGNKSMRFEVGAGDAFVVPRYHPMVQIAFSNETLVLVGFSSSAKRNHPQFMAGRASVLRTLDRNVVARSYNMNTTLVDRILESQNASVILKCVSCAEKERRAMEEERRREEEEERRRREEEEAKRQEEERRRQQEEEEAEEREREEEARKREEERREREGEEARKREEERRRHEAEEEEARRQREEEERRHEAEEEEERRQREEEEEAAERQEEARKREEEKRRREAEEEARRQEKERRRREEEEEEEEEEARRQEEKRRKWQKEEAEKARKPEEEKRRQEEAEKREPEEGEEGETREEEQAAEQERKWEEEMGREEEEAKRIAPATIKLKQQA